MRRLLALCSVTIVFSSARAQDQEGKLLDRLLKPNTTLQSSAQNKKFVADRASIHKRATVGAFYLHEKSKPKTFSQTRDFASWQFNARASAASTRTFFPRKKKSNTDRTYLTRTSPSLRGATDADKITDTRDFSGNRPFLDEGKSQKSLSQKNRPLTIDEVRELLNKNK